MSWRVLNDYLWLIFALAPFVWCVRLWRLKLTGRYPSLSAYLVFLILYPIVEHGITLPAFRALQEVIYRWFYFATHPIWWTLSFLVVLEIFQRMLAGYRGFQRLGELTKYGALGTVALVVSMMMAVDPAGDAPGTLAVRAILLQQRGVYIAITVLCLLLASFAAVFHLSTPKNVQYIFGAFGGMFAGFAVLQTLSAHVGSEMATVDAIAGPVLHIGCMLSGGLLFSRAGEEAGAPVPGHSLLAFDTGTEALLVGRLEGFNELLLKVLRS